MQLVGHSCVPRGLILESDHPRCGFDPERVNVAPRGHHVPQFTARRARGALVSISLNLVEFVDGAT